MYLEYYLILIIKIASCLGQQYVFRSHSALANMMCSAEKVQFSTPTINDISCVRACSLTQNCHAVIFYHGNKTCFGLNTDDPFNVIIPLTGAVFYKPNSPISQASTQLSTSSTSQDTTALPTSTTPPATSTTPHATSTTTPVTSMSPPATSTIPPATSTTTPAIVTTAQPTTTPTMATTPPATVTTPQPTATTTPTTTTMAQTLPTTTTVSTTSPVVFHSGVTSYGEEYLNDADKTTTFTAPEGKRVLLTFSGVEIECTGNANCWSPVDGILCSYDYLDILENGVSATGRLCGTSPGYVYQSTESSVTVVFRTDYGGTYRGYQLEVAYVPAV